MLFLVQISLYIHFGSGPLWKFFYNEIEDKCKKYWWSVLLYIQNYYNKDDVVSALSNIILTYEMKYLLNLLQCLIHTWYLSADMQLFVISPIVLIPLAIALRNPKRFIITMCGMGVLNILLAALSVFIKLQFKHYEK